MSTTTPFPEKMHAWTYTTRGSPSTVLTLSRSMATPAPPTGADILVHITHAALNPIDLLLMSLFPLPFPSSLLSTSTPTPSIPGIEFSGYVMTTGPAVATSLALSPGSPVFGILPPSRIFHYGGGTLAEYSLLPADCVMRVPEGMKMEEAVGLSGNGQTAMRLCQEGAVERGGRVLMNGASGGVGTLAVQMAKQIVGEEGYVVGICSGKNAELVKGLGADEVIDYTKHPSVTSYLTSHYASQPFTSILDTLGNQTLFTSSPTYLTPSGTYANVGYYSSGPLMTLYHTLQSILLPTWLGGVPRTYKTFSAQPTRKAAEELVQMVEQAKLRVVVDGVWACKDGKEAFERMASKRAVGKVVVRMA